LKPAIVLGLSLIYLVIPLLFWFIWPLVNIRAEVGWAFTLVNLVGLIIFFWTRQKRKLARPQPGIVLKMATFVWFLTIFVSLVTATLGGIDNYYKVNPVTYKDTKFLLVVSSGCSIECFVSFNVYRCLIGDIVCPQAMATITNVPNFSVNDSDYSLAIDTTTGDLNLLEKDKILRTFR